MFFNRGICKAYCRVKSWTYKQNFEEISIMDENLAFKTFNELADFNQFKADNKLFLWSFFSVTLLCLAKKSNFQC